MKNKFNLINFLICFFIIIFNYNKSLADDLVIDAEEVEIKDKGNLIRGVGSVNINDNDNLLISGDEAIYDRIQQKVEITGNVNVFNKLKNYKAKSDKVIFDRKQNLILTFDNTNINLLDRNNSNTILKLSKIIFYSIKKVKI